LARASGRTGDRDSNRPNDIVEAADGQVTVSAEIHRLDDDDISSDGRRSGSQIHPGVRLTDLQPQPNQHADGGATSPNWTTENTRATPIGVTKVPALAHH